MKTFRLIDWLKLAPVMLAAALIGCDNAAEDATPDVGEPIGADSSVDAEAGDDLTSPDPSARIDAEMPAEETEPAPVEPAEEAEAVEEAPAEAEAEAEAEPETP